MTPSRPIRALMLAFIVLSCGAAVHAAPLRVYILAGQSNMQGHARLSTLPHMAMDPATTALHDTIIADDQPIVHEQVRIVYFTTARGGKDVRREGALTVGYGSGGDSDDVMGPELAFGITMQDAVQEPILIIKTAWGGKSVYGDFRPPSAGPMTEPEAHPAPGPYYTKMVDSIKSVLADLPAAVPGYDPQDGYELSGFVWFQGWNDMVNGKIYPDRGKPDGYAAYTETLALLIKDLRRDLKAPDMPAVIGVLGVGGHIENSAPRYRPIHQGFRDAMAAAADRPEFTGNVVAVQTWPYWPEDLDAALSRQDAIKSRIHAQFKAREKAEGIAEKSKDEQRAFSRERSQAMDAAVAAELSADDQHLIKVGRSNQAYHYLGSAKTLGQIGQAFAEALIKLQAD